MYVDMSDLYPRKGGKPTEIANTFLISKKLL